MTILYSLLSQLSVRTRQVARSIIPACASKGTVYRVSFFEDTRKAFFGFSRTITCAEDSFQRLTLISPFDPITGLPNTSSVFMVL